MFSVRINPNEVVAQMAREAVESNDGYCPCKVYKNADSKCMCKEFREQTEVGLCECGLYELYEYTPIVCLCGSTRFKEQFMQTARDFTKEGYIVVMPHIFLHSGDECTDEEKKQLDKLHKEKIKLADLVYIINPNRYIGESTKNEIEFAKKLGKEIDYLEQE